MLRRCLPALAVEGQFSTGMHANLMAAVEDLIAFIRRELALAARAAVDGDFEVQK
jgi:hypothetical protein